MQRFSWMLRAQSLHPLATEEPFRIARNFASDTNSTRPHGETCGRVNHMIRKQHRPKYCRQCGQRSL